MKKITMLLLTVLAVIILGVAGGLLLALWLALVVWAVRDVRARLRSSAAAVLTALLVLLSAAGNHAAAGRGATPDCWLLLPSAAPWEVLL